jgi:hypothetical protein
MKSTSTFVSAIIFLAGVLAQAQQPSALEKQCASGIYCIEKMVCVSRIVGTPPRGMQPDYFVNVISVRSFKSAKKQGGGLVGWVDSLMINVDPVGRHAPNLTLAQAQKIAKFDYGNYGSPAYVRDGLVKTTWGSNGSFSSGLNLKIVNSQSVPGGRLDRLIGSQATVGSVVGNFSESLECEAFVVAAPSLIVDGIARR